MKRMWMWNRDFRRTNDICEARFEVSITLDRWLIGFSSGGGFGCFNFLCLAFLVIDVDRTSATLGARSTTEKAN